MVTLRTARSTLLAGSALIAASLSHPATGQPPKHASWLDGGAANWNQAGAAIPKAAAGHEENRQRCKNLLRPPSGVHDRALMKEGWWLYGPLLRFGRTVVVTGASDLDGMCRPMGFQVFVFVDRKFAGTLSPVAMDSRADGSQSRFFLSRERGILSEYARYSKDDPLCCPSGSATVDFQIEEKPTGPVVVPAKPVPAPVPAPAPARR